MCFLIDVSEKGVWEPHGKVKSELQGNLYLKL